LGKLCWHRETGENYDITIARRRFLNVAQDIINKTSQYKFEKVILPVGNDFFNADTPDDTTT